MARHVMKPSQLKPGMTFYRDFHPDAYDKSVRETFTVTEVRKTTRNPFMFKVYGYSVTLYQDGTKRSSTTGYRRARYLITRNGSWQYLKPWTCEELDQLARTVA